MFPRHNTFSHRGEYVVAVDSAVLCISRTHVCMHALSEFKGLAPRATVLHRVAVSAQNFNRYYYSHFNHKRSSGGSDNDSQHS